MPFKDFATSVSSKFHERLTNPLLVTFTVCWLLWNYEVIVILLSGLTPSEKILEIRTMFLDWRLYVDGALLPLIAALFCLFILPFPTRWVLAFCLRQQRLQGELRQRIEGATTLTIEESREIKMAQYKAEEEYDNTISKLKAEIKLLKEELRRSDATSSRSSSTTDTLRTTTDHATASELKLTREEVEVLSFLHRNKSVHRNSLMNGLSVIDDLSLEVAVDSLLSSGKINEEYDNHTGLELLSLTPVGRKSLKLHKGS
jgi:uncharacterized protein YdaT